MESKISFRTIKVQTALTRLKRKVPYGWDLNIYRGCQHGCKYCYAVYSHKYLGSDCFSSDIYVKGNIVDRLEEELGSEDWNREVINIGGVTDSYQPAEKQFRLMPEILKLLIKYKTPAIISTKSDLALRDFDLIDQLSRITYINIAATITTTDEGIRFLMEPGSATAQRRFKMLKEFKKTNASTGLHLMPIIPYITDKYENLDKILGGAKDAGVDYVLPGTLYLRGASRKVFFEFVQKEFPDKYEAIKTLYKTGGAGKEYKDRLYKTVNELRSRYGLSGSYMKPMKEKLSQQAGEEWV